MQIIDIGTKNRLTRSTDFNLTSSRSHAVLQMSLTIEQQFSDGQIRIFRSKLNLVDLAGAEAVAKN